MAFVVWKLLKRLAPQVGLEPTTLRLTAEWLVAASHCKHNCLCARKPDFGGNWGNSGGTRPTVQLRSQGPAHGTVERAAR